ncbi:MAG: hypothetical protein IKG40_00695, partial [Bacilli bacterium]|nr:hypothetical protein [Bacilli bacterium]
GGSISNGTNIQLYKSNKTNAQKFILKVYGDTKTYHGIDISRWQGNINWRVFEEEIPNFIIMKIGTSYDQKDVKFETYYANAVRYDIPIGVYNYSYAVNTIEAKLEADATIRWLNNKDLDLPIFYDLESLPQTTLGKNNLTLIAETFCDTIQLNGYRCGVYANLYWLTYYLDAKKLALRYPIWLAHYTGASNYSQVLNNYPYYQSSYNLTPYQYWQFSSTGVFKSITENTVDLDFGYNIFD